MDASGSSIRILPAVRYWIPPLLWTAVILLASSDLFSATHTGSVLEIVITAILGHPLSRETFDLLHFLIRKAAHLTEYGILSALLFRAIRRERSGWMSRWAATAVAIAACVASFDEWRQTFVPSRTGTPVDVGIDTVGAALAQLLLRAVQMLFF